MTRCALTLTPPAENLRSWSWLDGQPCRGVARIINGVFNMCLESCLGNLPPKINI